MTCEHCLRSFAEHLLVQTIVGELCTDCGAKYLRSHLHEAIQLVGTSYDLKTVSVRQLALELRVRKWIDNKVADTVVAAVLDDVLNEQDEQNKWRKR